MNAGEMKQGVLYLIGEENYDRFTAVEVLFWLNRALEDIANKTGFLTTRYPLATIPTQREYAMATYFAGAKLLFRATYNNDWLPPTSIIDLDEIADDSGSPWLTATGSPANWYFSNQGNPSIYPIPDDAYTVNFYGMSKDTTLVNDGDTPGLPGQFHLAPCLFAAAQIKREDKELTEYGTLMSDYRGSGSGKGKKGMIGDMLKELNKIKYQGSTQAIKLAGWSP